MTDGACCACAGCWVGAPSAESCARGDPPLDPEIICNPPAPAAATTRASVRAGVVVAACEPPFFPFPFPLVPFACTTGFVTSAESVATLGAPTVIVLFLFGFGSAADPPFGG